MEPSRKRKATKAEAAQRQAVVYGQLTKGFSRYQIHQEAAEMWKLGERAIDQIIKNAREQLEKDCSITREAFLAESLQGLRSIRAQAERRGQLQTATNAIRLMTELTGLTK